MISPAEARLPRWMAGVAAAGTLIALASGHGRMAAGFLLGAATAVLAYSWLHQTVAALLDLGRTRVPKRMVLKVAIRYPLAFGLMYLFYRTGWVPLPAVIAGLFVPAAGALIECVLQVGEHFLAPVTARPEELAGGDGAEPPASTQL
jgi:hypothetical protein